ncbi:hypothetical protein BpHYR1_003393 [Brachionus plicatilis]|uniref:Uncharacterized protein n=1 Tax=Brachionus plicatilis TaxID=10195 RepID=A0A3M7PZD8_BRAPC|nr:hypothetical protein BpHYR1_003393 [Brachionus plicatilis]
MPFLTNSAVNLYRPFERLLFPLNKTLDTVSTKNLSMSKNIFRKIRLLNRSFFRVITQHLKKYF